MQFDSVSIMNKERNVRTKQYKQKNQKSNSVQSEAKLCLK